MRKLLVSVLLISNVSFAAELIVFEKPAAEIPRFHNLNSILQINYSTSEGQVRLTAEQEMRQRRCSGRREDRECSYETTSFTVFSKDIIVPDLLVEGNKLIFRSSSRSVDCGTLGVTRVFRRPTLYLTGACSTRAEVTTRDGQDFIQVTFLVKE